MWSMNNKKTNILKTLRHNFILEIIAFTSSQMLTTDEYNSTVTDTKENQKWTFTNSQNWPISVFLGTIFIQYNIIKDDYWLY